MNETLILIATISRIIMNVVIICAIGVVIYNRKRIREFIEDIRRGNAQGSHEEEELAFMERRDGDVNRELR